MIEENKITELECVSSFHYINETDSTNEYAKQIIEDSNGIQVVTAGRQTNGRGRNGRSFFSSLKGGLWVSLSLNIDDISNHFRVNRALSLAVYDTICFVTDRKDAAIKWPNDIYINDRKVCGILLETTSKKPERIIAGFGLNLNFPSSVFPPELSEIATTLHTETGEYFDKTEVLKKIIISFDNHLNESQKQSHQLYNHCLYGKNRQIEINNERGKLKGVTEKGELIMQKEETNKYFITGDLKYE